MADVDGVLRRLEASNAPWPSPESTYSAGEASWAASLLMGQDAGAGAEPAPSPEEVDDAAALHAAQSMLRVLRLDVQQVSGAARLSNETVMAARDALMAKQSELREAQRRNQLIRSLVRCGGEWWRWGAVEVWERPRPCRSARASTPSSPRSWCNWSRTCAWPRGR